MKISALVLAAACVFGCARGNDMYRIEAPNGDKAGWKQSYAAKDPEQPLMARYRNEKAKANVFVLRSRYDLDTTEQVAWKYRRDRAVHDHFVTDVSTQGGVSMFEMAAYSGRYHGVTYVAESQTGEMIVVVATWAGNRNSGRLADKFVHELLITPVR